MARRRYVPAESVFWGLSLADEDLLEAYKLVPKESLEDADYFASRFLCVWYDDYKYRDPKTLMARDALLRRLRSMHQGVLFENPSDGLTKWFGEKWVDICHPPDNHKSAPETDWKKCGRQDDDARAYPKCRPLKTARSMTAKEMKAACRRKRRVERMEDDDSPGRPPNMVNPRKRG